MTLLKPIRVGLIGGGAVARAHVSGFINVPDFFATDTGFERRIIAEATPELARKAAKRWGFRQGTAHWKEVTRSDDVDLIDVVTPTYLHVEPSIDALEHGKSVLCEKPLATTSHDARRMLDVARRAGVTTMVGFNYRRVPAVTLAKQMIKEGKLGRVYQIRSQFFEDWGGPDCPHTWRFKSETAGAGALADLGSHALDMVRYLVGEPTEVCALQGRFIDERKPVGKNRKARSNVDDTSVALLRIEGGILGEVAASWLATGRKVALDFEVHGSEGSLSFTMERPNELNHYSFRDPQDARGFKRIYFGPHHPYGSTLIFGSPTLGTGYVDSLVNQMHDLMVAIREETQIEPSFYDGWKVNVAIDAILESSRKGRWTRIG